MATSEPSKDRLPDSPGAVESILSGKILISEKCPNCGAKFATPHEDLFCTCLDCYTQFKPEDNDIR